MRLIDAAMVGREMADTWQKVLVLQEVESTPTIDPENLPVVRQLRAELARVTTDRGKLAQYELDVCEESCFGDLCVGISKCEWLDSKGHCKLKEWAEGRKEV